MVLSRPMASCSAALSTPAADLRHPPVSSPRLLFCDCGACCRHLICQPGWPCHDLVLWCRLPGISPGSSPTLISQRGSFSEQAVVRHFHGGPVGSRGEPASSACPGSMLDAHLLLRMVPMHVVLFGRLLCIAMCVLLLWCMQVTPSA